jgi:hypothetical protein
VKNGFDVTIGILVLLERFASLAAFIEIPGGNFWWVLHAQIVSRFEVTVGSVQLLISVK